jgi:ABC-type Fe3+ transport system permease subunit
MDIFSLKWFAVGILISIPLHLFYLSIRTKVSKMRPEDKLATNTIIQTLGLVVIVGAFALGIYGNYLTAKAGEGKMNQSDFAALVAQFSHWFSMYMAFIWTLAGIAVGTGLIIMFRNIWRYFSRRQSVQDGQDNLEITISKKEADSIIKRRDDYSKAKTIVDDFLKKLSDENKDK